MLQFHKECQSSNFIVILATYRGALSVGACARDAAYVEIGGLSRATGSV